MAIVDAWMQHPSVEFLADPMFKSLWGRWTPRGSGPACCAPGGDRKGRLSQTTLSPRFTTRYPDRFAGVAAVDLARPMDAVRELRRCVRDLGFRALRVVPWLWNLPPSDGPMCPSEPSRTGHRGGHIGYPSTAEMISLATKYPNVYTRPGPRPTACEISLASNSTTRRRTCSCTVTPSASSAYDYQSSGYDGAKVDDVNDRDKDLRVSDAERDAVVKVLGDHASVGRLTLDELEDRSSKALEAKTRAELDTLTTDLPDLESTPGQPISQQRRPVRWLVSILGGAVHAGRSRAAGTINAIAILGGGEIDLRNAEIQGGELTINSFAVLGGPDIFVPDTIDVDAGGICILGGIQEHGSARSPRPGAPVVKLRAFAVLGGANIYRVPPEMRGRPTREIRRSAMAERHIGHHGHAHHGHHGGRRLSGWDRED